MMWIVINMRLSNLLLSLLMRSSLDTRQILKVQMKKKMCLLQDRRIKGKKYDGKLAFFLEHNFFIELNLLDYK